VGVKRRNEAISFFFKVLTAGFFVYGLAGFAFGLPLYARRFGKVEGWPARMGHLLMALAAAVAGVACWQADPPR
jgi:hypothetical protein